MAGLYHTSQREYDARVERVRSALAERELDAHVVFDPIGIAYLTGFYHLPTERPMALVIPHSGELGILIPDLERDHVGKTPAIRTVQVYPEYPTGPTGAKHPMEHMADLLRSMRLGGKRLGADMPGYAARQGYEGPSLAAAFTTGKIVDAPDLVNRLRQVKSAEEIGFIREASKWANLAHQLMQDGVAVGASEIEVSLRASMEASLVMMKTLGPDYTRLNRGRSSSPAEVRFRAGRSSALPHGLQQARGIRPGDSLITYANAEVAGYGTELERTLVVGEPTPEYARHFNAMVEIQAYALAALRPGRPLHDVERDVRGEIERRGLLDMTRHHTGHGIGLEGHEQPFIDFGDATVVEPGMVFSVEPGLYVPGVAGFRHSDTVVVTESGAESLTYYPRDLASLTVG